MILINSTSVFRTGGFGHDMNGNTGIPKYIFKDIQGKDMSVNLRLSNDMEWVYESNE